MCVQHVPWYIRMESFNHMSLNDTTSIRYPKAVNLHWASIGEVVNPHALTNITCDTAGHSVDQWVKHGFRPIIGPCLTSVD